MVKQLASIEGVHFSISGHTLRLSDKKLRAMLREASTPNLDLLSSEVHRSLISKDLSNVVICGAFGMPSFQETRRQIDIS